MFFWPGGSEQSLIVQSPVDEYFSARLDNATRPDTIKRDFSSKSLSNTKNWMTASCYREITRFS